MIEEENTLKEISSHLGHFPSRMELEQMGLSQLSSRVQKSGGFRLWAEKLGFVPKVSWNKELVLKELRPICESLGSMPSSQYLKSIGRNDLSCAIVRQGGFENIASLIGFAREHSDSDTGWDGEKALLSLFLEKGFKCERSVSLKAPHDLLINDLIRIDVKSANYAEYGPSKGWFYRIGKEAQADIIALYEIDRGNVYFIPWNICPKTNITISVSGGKYKNFKNRFDLIELLSEKRKSELDMWNILD
jgi:hypothetical protein